MKKHIAILMLCAAWALPASAQDAPKAEAFLGYSFFRLSGGNGLNVPGGWHASLAGNFNRYFGLVGDFSGHYKSIGGANFNVHTFTFGPRFTYRSEKPVEAFGHFTVGGVRVGAGAAGFGVSDTSFAFTIGGGVDIKASPRVAIRPVQLDYVARVAGGNTQNNLRYSAGVVFRF